MSVYVTKIKGPAGRLIKHDIRLAVTRLFVERTQSLIARGRNGQSSLSLRCHLLRAHPRTCHIFWLTHSVFRRSFFSLFLRLHSPPTLPPSPLPSTFRLLCLPAFFFIRGAISLPSSSCSRVVCGLRRFVSVLVKSDHVSTAFELLSLDLFQPSLHPKHDQRTIS
jgi:hypothetical protein